MNHSNIQFEVHYSSITIHQHKESEKEIKKGKMTTDERDKTKSKTIFHGPNFEVLCAPF